MVWQKPHHRHNQEQADTLREENQEGNQCCQCLKYTIQFQYSYRIHNHKLLLYNESLITNNNCEILCEAEGGEN